MNYIVTGSRMHNKGWRSVYCVTKRDAFRGTAPINLTDRLHQVLRWATGSVEIFSRNNALFASRMMKSLQRVAYFNVGMYPFTSLFLIVYCFLPTVSLFTGQFIVQTLSVTFLVFLLMITLTLCFLAILEIKWSGITLHDWWRNEQFWLIGGTSAHPAAVMQGLLKVLRGGPCECGFKICRECYLDCVGSGGGHCPGCKEPYKECALCWTEVVTGSVTFNSPRGSRGLIQMIDLGLWRVCKALLAEYIAVQKRNRPFKGLGLEHMNKSCPVVPSQLTSNSLRSSQFHTDIFCLRERDLLINFAAEISQLQAQGLSREYALLQSYQLAKDLGRAFLDRAILQTFLDAEAAVSSGPLKSMLSLLRSMHVLIILEEDASFLRYGYLSPDNAVGIRKEVTILCSELRPHALALVSSFGILDAFLSRIAFNWIDANSWSLVQPQQRATVPL